MTRRLGWMGLIWLVAFSVSGAFAQGSKKSDEGNVRAVQGTVSDADGNAVEGAVVQLKTRKLSRSARS